MMIENIDQIATRNWVSKRFGGAFLWGENIFMLIFYG